MNEMHRRFQKLLVTSEAAVWEVMLWLNQKGYTIRKEPISVAPKVEDKDQHKDDADFDVIIDGKRKPIEVKHLSRNFTGPRNWPFGHKFIVDSVNTFDAKSRRPFMYIVVSSDMNNMCMVDVEKTMPHWYKEKKPCGNYDDVGGLTSEFYVMDTRHVTSWHKRNAARKEPA